MTATDPFFDTIPLQDRDLLSRLREYFDGFGNRLKEGQGWFIFNAASDRSQRITGYVHTRLVEQSPAPAYYIMPWRDFALSAYVQHLGLDARQPDPDGNAKALREYRLARHVTEETQTALTYSDFLLLTGIRPSHLHEAVFLDWLVEQRYQRRLPTMLVTPDLPQDLQAQLSEIDPTNAFWRRLFDRMYETSLVAL